MTFGGIGELNADPLHDSDTLLTWYEAFRKTSVLKGDSGDGCQCCAGRSAGDSPTIQEEPGTRLSESWLAAGRLPLFAESSPREDSF